MLIKGDCLTEMKKIEDNTVDLLFCDLPWSATSCSWDCALDLPLFWKQVNRVCKINCPMFFCCNAKFGNTLINSNPKNFRYDLVWIKSAPVGFLNAKKMPMKKHELIYVFYRKLPMYDLSSHKHKFLGEQTEDKEYCKYDINKNCYGGGKENRIKISKKKEDHSIKYDPPLPTSIIKEDKRTTIYGDYIDFQPIERKNGESIYDPPLPTSIIKEKQIRNTPKLEEGYGKDYLTNKPNYRLINPNLGANGTDSHIYDPPLPTSIIKDEIDEKYKNKGGLYSKISRNGLLKNETHYDPPLPTSIIKTEGKEDSVFGKTEHYSIDQNLRHNGGLYDPPLPTSIIKDDLFIRGKQTNSENKDVYNYNERLKNGTLYHHARKLQKGDEPIYDPPLPTSIIKTDLYSNKNIEGKRELYRNESKQYDPPLPNSILEIKSEKGKHATQKPVQLIEWILKYYSKVGDTVLDPTMGSGSSGVACINMKRKYIGIEKDDTIFKVAKSRICN